MLTEHLCTIISHNEDRKAKKLSELLEKVGLNESLDMCTNGTHNNTKWYMQRMLPKLTLVMIKHLIEIRTTIIFPIKLVININGNNQMHIG